MEKKEETGPLRTEREWPERISSLISISLSQKSYDLSTFSEEIGELGVFLARVWSG